MSTNTGVPAFPVMAKDMSLRDWFAATAPEPVDSDIKSCLDYDRMRNPHNDSYKPALRSREEITCFLRYKRADAMLAAREAKQ